MTPWQLTDARQPLNASGSPKVHELTPKRIVGHWKDMLRVAASLHLGTVRSHDLIRMLARDGSPTPLGAAIADYSTSSR